MTSVSTQHQAIRFLLAEDDDDHADLIARGMRRNRIANELHRVSNGEEAIAYLKQVSPFEDAPRPDIILLDLKMPKLDGHAVLEVVKNDPELRQIPVVVMTTSKAEADRARAYDANANSYLVKPLDFARFNEMVQHLETYWAIWNVSPRDDDTHSEAGCGSA